LTNPQYFIRQWCTAYSLVRPLWVNIYLLRCLSFFNDSFNYVRELHGEGQAILEFEVEIESIKVNGVDMIRWSNAGLITEFKVMLRPLKAVNLIHEQMGAMLRAQTPRAIK
jgi:hypothetical protein